MLGWNLPNQPNYATEEDTRPMYANIVFMKGDDADEAFAAAGYDGNDSSSIDPAALLNYLSQWDYGDESECDTYRGPVSGDYEDGDYVLSYSWAYGTCGLERKVTEE